MAKAFKCDYCNTMTSGNPITEVELHISSNSTITYKKVYEEYASYADICKQCFVKLVNQNLG